MHLFFDLTHFRELGQKYKIIFVGFLVQMKTFKSAFEINRPLPKHLLTHFCLPIIFRCEAINKANEQNPAVTRISYRVFFPPQSLSIVVDRPDKGSGYDRTIDFELAVGVASSSTRNRQDDVRIVVAGELVTLRCEAGNFFKIWLYLELFDCF